MSLLRRLARSANATAMRIVTAPVLIYTRVVSPLIPPRCRYYPTCSTYGLAAIRRYGVVRGVVLAAWRVIRCNPWSLGGVDLVEDQRLFRRRGHDCGTRHPVASD